MYVGLNHFQLLKMSFNIISIDLTNACLCLTNAMRVYNCKGQFMGFGWTGLKTQYLDFYL